MSRGSSYKCDEFHWHHSGRGRGSGIGKRQRQRRIFVRGTASSASSEGQMMPENQRGTYMDFFHSHKSQGTHLYLLVSSSTSDAALLVDENLCATVPIILDPSDPRSCLVPTPRIENEWIGSEALPGTGTNRHPQLTGRKIAIPKHNSITCSILEL